MDSTMIDLGFFQIKWYSFFMLVAILTASIFVYLEARKKELEKDEIIDMIFYGVLIGIVGARVYYVLFNLNYYLKDPIEIICIWHGGLAIHGALIATLLFLYFYCNKKNRNLLLLLDIIVVGIIIGQAIGRWGNFFNGEAFGRTVELSFLRNLHLPKFIIQGMYIDNQYRRKGIGKKLVQEFKDYCISQGIEEIKVTALSKNFSARSFYENCGFDEFEVTYKMKL